MTYHVSEFLLAEGGDNKHESSFSSFYPAKNEENCGRGVVFGSTAGEGWCRGLKGHSAREVDGAGLL